MSNTQKLISNIRDCRLCETANPPMALPARPILRGSTASKIRIISQAPGNLAYQSGVPFSDPSGERLRDWLGVNKATFYEADNFAITPIGFCFPGHNRNGGDLPPRKECAPLWQDRLTEVLPYVELTLLVGLYAQRQVLRRQAASTLTETVKNWKNYGPNIIPLPHPSWRNNVWIKRNIWFEGVVSELKRRVDILVERR